MTTFTAMDCNILNCTSSFLWQLDADFVPDFLLSVPVPAVQPEGTDQASSRSSSRQRRGGSGSNLVQNLAGGAHAGAGVRSSRSTVVSNSSQGTGGASTSTGVGSGSNVSRGGSKSSGLGGSADRRGHRLWVNGHNGPDTSAPPNILIASRGGDMGIIPGS